MKGDKWITVLALQIRVRPVPHWNHDPSQNGGFYTTLLAGGGTGVHLGGGRDTFESAKEVAQWLLDNPAEYADIHADLERSNNLTIPQWYLDMCRGQEL